ncbi:CPBP family glutamic-type intramembrane protease [Marinilabilia rubra]|uniref:CPBP family intramembrane metalloprotease n=1 Tax=Marinilabilia rubra TaxID=2162893 RepID=A0A2U2B8P7_9BACT|nr:CPBP family glutamic-type intramembrane protease [Marinilabilia rubra]PWD99449.1 CPBP family intramembrane metalloprotease [Marinilabilia rubra]
MYNDLTISDKRKWLEILAVALTGALKFILMDWLELRAFYISSACLFWIFYILRRFRTDRHILYQWGFRKDGFKRTVFFCLVFTVPALAGIIIYGIIYTPEFFQWNLIPILALYPLWGVIQQFMMIGVIAGNLRTISTLTLNEKQVVLLVSVLFALAHSPDWLLMGFTFVMEIFFIRAYFKYKNLWALGILHGWLGGLFLYFLMQRDLWHELWVIF